MDNKPRKLCRTMEEVDATLDQFPRLGLTCDLAHLALNDIDQFAFLDRFSERIRHIHASGVVTGKPHGKTSLKESEVDMVPALRRFADRDIAVVIENNTSETVAESLSALQTHRHQSVANFM